MKLAAFDIVKKHTQNPHVLIARCPFCEDKAGHVHIDTKKDLYYCHRCGKGGKIQSGKRQKAPEITRMEKPQYDLTRYNRKVQPKSPHWAYLRNRGFTSAEIERLDPRYGDDIGRVFFPVFDRTRTEVYVTGRAIGTASPKWWFPTSLIGKSHCLWGINHIKEGSRVVLVEGIFDAVWSTDRLAIFGSSISVTQISMLVRLQPSHIVVCLDPEAHKEAAKAAFAIASAYTVPIFNVKLEDGVDPCDLGAAGNEAMLDLMERVV